jgi:phospholipid transport system transporter-binding protein
MSEAVITAKGNDRFGVEGVLDFTTAARLASEGERLFKGRGPIEIDLRGVSSANSAGLALLLEWMELARRRNLPLRFRNLPESLARLSDLTNLTRILPVSRSDA